MIQRIFINFMEILNGMLDLNNFIVRLQQIEGEPAAKFEDVVEVLNELIGQPYIAPSITMSAGILVLRARPVDSFDEVLHESQISYLPPQNCTKFGRANMPGNPLFYGVLVNRNERTVIQNIPASRILTLYEGCQFFREPMKDGEYRAVVGCWETLEPLRGLTIINPEQMENRAGINKEVADALPAFLSSLNTELREKGTEFYSDEEIVNFLRYMHHKFTDDVNDNKEYWIPAKFASDVLKFPELDGIFYESSQGRVDDKLNECISVALKPESVDTKLHFLGVYDVLIRKDQGGILIPLPKFREL